MLVNEEQNDSSNFEIQTQKSAQDGRPQGKKEDCPRSVSPRLREGRGKEQSDGGRRKQEDLPVCRAELCERNDVNMRLCHASAVKTRGRYRRRGGERERGDKESSRTYVGTSGGLKAQKARRRKKVVRS